MSAATIDPYVEWLGLPPGTDAPDHYALLGVPRTEADKGRIEAAFRARYALVRNYQIKWPVLATRLLDELSNASVCLTDPARKAEYDRSLAPSYRLLPEPPPTRADVVEAVVVHSAPSNRPLPDLPRRPTASNLLPLPEPLPLPDADPFPQPDDEAEPQPLVRWDDLFVRIREALPILLPAVASVIFLTVLGVVLFSSRSRPNAVPDAADEPPAQTARTATPVQPAPQIEEEPDAPGVPEKVDNKVPIPPAPLPVQPAIIGTAPVVKVALKPGDLASSVRCFLAGNRSPVGVLIRSSQTPIQTSVFDARNGREISRSKVVSLDPRGITDVSPTGRYVVALEVTNDRGRVTGWDTELQRTMVKDDAPTAQLSWRDGPPAPGLVANPPRSGNGVVWAGFVADDRLLTLTGHGGFDVWTLPGAGMVREHRVEGVGDYFDDLVVLNRVPSPSVSPFPRGFALSQDRRMLARFTGDRFQFFDTATGKMTAETESTSGKVQPVPVAHRRVEFYLAGMAFDSREATLAVVGHVPQYDKSLLLLIDPTTGRPKPESRPLDRPITAALGNSVRWWGKYVVISGVTDHTPIDPSTGAVLAPIHPQHGGAFLPDTRDGLLWCYSPALTPGGSPCIYALAAPPSLPVGFRVVTATPDGLVDGRR